MRLLTFKNALFAFALFSVALMQCDQTLAEDSGNADSGLKLNYQQLLDQGQIRIAVPYDPTIYVDDKGKPIGMSVQISQSFGKWLSERYKRQVKVKLVPTVPGKLIDPLDMGAADIALGYLGEYEQRLDSAKYLSLRHAEHQKQILVSGPNAPAINSEDDLSGKIICLGRQTRIEALKKLNERLIQKGRAPAILYKDHVALDDEAMLQMANDGLIQFVMSTEWRANLWKPYLKNIQIHSDIEFDIGGNIGWAIRDVDKALQEDILAFSSGQLNDEAILLFAKDDFNQRKNALKDPKSKEDWARFMSMRPLFEKYGNQYDLSPLFLASFGFQETMLNQDLISPSGAIGVMQLTASTGSAMDVGNIRQLDSNIHAGAKYLNQLASQNFNGDGLDKSNQALFAIASYNIGPANVIRARKLASKLGFDPNKWFLNVEMAASELFGIEPMNYVRNVYKYFVAYQLSISPSLNVSLEHMKPLGD